MSAPALCAAIRLTPNVKLWSALRRKALAGAKFRRQYPLGEFFADFCCLEHKLIIEVDGGQHAQAQEYDQRRAKFLQSLSFGVLRFWNTDVLINLEGVVAGHLAAPSPILTFPRN